MKEEKEKKIAELRSLMKSIAAKPIRSKSPESREFEESAAREPPLSGEIEDSGRVAPLVDRSWQEPTLPIRDTMNQQKPLPLPLGDLVSGTDIITDDGTIFVTEEWLPVDSFHGSERLSQAHDISPETLWLLNGDADMRHFSVERAVFLDTETTGLARSSGTHAFMVGCGWFDGDSVVVRQYFMHRLEDDAALVAMLIKDLSSFTSIVSFNGKLFDVPLLRTRFLMNGKPFPLGSAPHLDLLHCARRLWRERLRWCNLTNLESNLLQIERIDDIPGSEIPDLYAEYRQSSNGWLMKQIFFHNRLDILSMISLLGFIARTVTLGERDKELTAPELFSLGMVHLSRDLRDDALDYLERARLAAPDQDLLFRINRVLAQEYKRLNHYESACELWETMILNQTDFDFYPFEELAKYYEHVTGQVDKAVDICHSALQHLGDERHYVSLRGFFEEKIQHRLNRLEKKGQKKRS